MKNFGFILFVLICLMLNQVWRISENTFSFSHDENSRSPAVVSMEFEE